MKNITRNDLNNLWAEDRQLQHQAFLKVMDATGQPFDRAYEIWDEVVANLAHKDNHNRAIAAQVLCNLAKSDPKARILKDFSALLGVTKDERFVTARHCLQSLWKVGTAGKKQQQRLIEGLEARFKECITEKNCTLIRYDIIVNLKQLSEVVKDEKIRAKALALMDTETDLKYRKKYAGVWKTR